MTEAEKISLITRIVDRFQKEADNDDGDKYLSQAEYAMEAITSVIDNGTGNPILRMFLEEPPR